MATVEVTEESFEATITSALEFGVFVLLKEVPIDGLVHVSAIPGDFWELEPSGMGLVGRSTGRRWQMGDAVHVRLTRVDLTQRQIDVKTFVDFRRKDFKLEARFRKQITATRRIGSEQERRSHERNGKLWRA